MVSSKRLPKKSISPSKYVAVPGKIMNWILKEGGKDIKNQLKNCQNKLNPKIFYENKSKLVVMAGKFRT